MGKTKKGGPSCLWTVAGFIILISSVMWLDEHSESLGCLKSSLFFVAIFISLVIYRTKISGGIRSNRSTDPLAKFASVTKKYTGYKLVLSCVETFEQEKFIQKNVYSDEEKEIITTVEKIVLDKEEIYLLDDIGNRVSETKYDNIYCVRKNTGRHLNVIILDKSQGKDFSLPSWSAKYNNKMLKMLSKRANLGEAEYTDFMRNEPMTTTYYRQKD